MMRRLLTAILLVTTLAVAGFGLPLAVAVHLVYRDEALLQLSEEAARAAVAVPASFARDRDVPELPDPAGGIAVALYDTAGHRVAGSGPATADPTVTATLHSGAPHRRPRDLVVAIPVSDEIGDEETVVGAIRTSLPAGAVTARTHRTWLVMGLLAAGVIAAAAMLAAWRSRHLAQPLARLRADADLIGAGGQPPRRPPTGIVEIDAIHAALTDAATQLGNVLARERAFSADLAHQLRTPLASLRLRLETEQLQPDLGAASSDDGEFLADALTDVDRLQQTIDDLLALARDTDQRRDPHPVATPIRAAAERWRPRLAAAGRPLVITVEPQLPWTTASPAAIRQILDVLLDNALTHGAGTVQLSGVRRGASAVIAVTDQGTAVLDTGRLFTRRGNQATGTGIGLALARLLAEAEGLRLVAAHPGPGVTFHLIIAGQTLDGATITDR